mgnify:CR=1 FL=1
MRIASRVFYLLAAFCLVTFVGLLVADVEGNLFALFLVLMLICLGVGFQLDGAYKKREQKRQGAEPPEDPNAGAMKQAVLTYNATAATTQTVGSAKGGGLGSSYDGAFGPMSGTQKYGVLTTLADDLKKQD